MVVLAICPFADIAVKLQAHRLYSGIKAAKLP
jgi:hypothetical protein